MSFITRFAPSPTGRLHLGHAYSAMMVDAAARAAGGKMLLRIEDIDHTRCRPEFDAGIIEDLRWLGLSYDPPLWRQSERTALYEQRLQQLIDERLVYRCFKTRRELADAMDAPHGAPSAPYRGGPLPPELESQRLESGEPFAWRLWLERALEGTSEPLIAHEMAESGEVRPIEVDPTLHGDVVLARKDIGTSYHLASITDDIAAGITHIVRGEDLRDVLGLHTLIHRLLGAPSPIYRHHELIADETGERMAKRRGSQSLADLRHEGVKPADLYAQFGLPSPSSAAD